MLSGRTGAVLPNPRWMLTDASVHHDVRRDGVERHDRQMTHAHDASDEQGRDMEPSMLTFTGSVGPA